MRGRVVILPASPPPDVETAIRVATEYLSAHDLEYGHGTLEAVDDARWLVLEAAGLSPVEELPQESFNQILDGDTVRTLESHLQRRAIDRVPAAYIVGRTWFAGLEFAVDERVLVPRSPLAEFLLNDCFGLFDTSGMSRVLDLCTGSGCIAIAAATLYPDVTVDATDLSSDALAVARQNVHKHGLEERVALFEGDLFEPLDQTYELILANPPYVDQSDLEGMSREFHHEPRMGLAAGADGLDIVVTILRESPKYLQPGGVLVCEVGNSAEALQQRFEDWPFMWLEFAYGGSGVFAITREDIVACSDTA